MATAQRTRPRAAVGAPRRAAWQLKSLYVTASAQRRVLYYLHLCTVIAGELFIHFFMYIVQQRLVIM